MKGAVSFGLMFLAVCVVTIGTVGFFGGSRSIASLEGVIDRTLGAGWTREECVDADAGSRLFYAFKASGTVTFNVHHHVGRDTQYDVERHPTVEAESTLVVPLDARYCLTFTNEEQRDVDVDGRYEVLPAETN